MHDTFLYCVSGRCHWSGTVDALVATDEDPDSFIYCPDCEGDEFEEEDEEDYDEDDDEAL